MLKEARHTLAELPSGARLAALILALLVFPALAGNRWIQVANYFWIYGYTTNSMSYIDRKLVSYDEPLLPSVMVDGQGNAVVVDRYRTYVYQQSGGDYTTMSAQFGAASLQRPSGSPIIISGNRIVVPVWADAYSGLEIFGP